MTKPAKLSALFLFSLLALGCHQKQEDLQPQSVSQVKAFIVSPADGAIVSNPVTVVFGLEGMSLAPAGELKQGTGHHHLLVDLEALPPLDQPLPANEHIIHFGKAQTETTLNLTPGKHTLQLLLANGQHIPFDPPIISNKIFITVK